jgi:hypothetical protein
MLSMHEEGDAELTHGIIAEGDAELTHGIMLKVMQS